MGKTEKRLAEIQLAGIDSFWKTANAISMVQAGQQHDTGQNSGDRRPPQQKRLRNPAPIDRAAQTGFPIPDSSEAVPKFDQDFVEVSRR
ncbi:hypothetical protein PMKS-003245 [Pichia membranifaciens]|uniref:Uncharacterized protein n=1 Tax=Pichia membranifaciens TaxID=4926 RepID=A0A1Q2YK48_9ASCO|nr:hypothetical protein PMKS-003245 [Pichia membranifaciens]